MRKRKPVGRVEQDALVPAAPRVGALLHDGRRLAPLCAEARTAQGPPSPSNALIVPREGGDSACRAPMPLVALEAFIRKEHRLYLVEHPNCARAETLHIFREALAAFVDHFPEYRAVLHLIRDEYEAVLQDVAEQVREMKVLDMENKSDRSLHAMELMQLKESLNTTISNQQAQLHATQGLLHALREQLGAAEHANALLKFELESKLSEYEHAQEQVKLLSRAMIEESARAARIVEEAKRKDREIELMRAREVVLRESLSELEACLQQQMQQQTQPDADHVVGPSTGSRASARHSSSLLTQQQQHAAGTFAYSDEFVLNALQQLDALRFEVAALREKQQQQQSAPGVVSMPTWWTHTDAPPLRLHELAGAHPEADAPGMEADGGAHTVADAVSRYPVIERWLREEGIGEAELESTDTLLPPGLWPSEELAFLKACHPVHNRHLNLDRLLQLLEELWVARERQVDAVSFRAFFLEWLSAQTGSPSGAKELGFNLLHGCQRNLHQPDCRACLCVLRGFLPERMVLTCRAAMRRLHALCTEANTTATRCVIAVDTLCAHVREAFPALSQAHMLQLRFHLYRLGGSGGGTEVDVERLLATRSPFMVLLRSQYFREVEADTLHVVEGLRQVADVGRDSICIRRVMDVFRSFDPGMDRDTWHRLVAESCQKSVRDIAVAEETSVVRLEPLLNRLRTTILVHRVTPVSLAE